MLRRGQEQMIQRIDIVEPPLADGALVSWTWHQIEEAHLSGTGLRTFSGIFKNFKPEALMRGCLKRTQDMFLPFCQVESQTLNGT